MAWTVPITIEGQTYPVRFDSENEPTQEDIADAANYIASQQSAPQEDTGQGRVSTFASGLARGVLSPVPGVIGGAGALTGIDALTETAETIEQGINETFPMNPAYQEEFWTGKASQAIGQGVSMLAMGGVGGAIGKGLAAGRGLSAAGQAAAATQAATRTMFGTGAAMGAREGQQEGEKYGLTGLNLYARIVAGAAIEPLTEKLPFGMLAETSAMKRIFGDAINARPVSSAGIIATESVEEGLAQVGGDIATNIGTTIEGTQGIGLGEMIGRAGEATALGAVGGAPIAGLNLLAGKQEPMTFGGTHARQPDDTAFEVGGMEVRIPKGSPLKPEDVQKMGPVEFAEAADKLQIKIPRPSSVVAAELTKLAATGQPVPIDPQAIRPQDTPAIAVAAQTNPETLAAVVAMTTNTTPVAAPQSAPVAPQAAVPTVTPPEIVAGVEELSDAEALAIDAELGIEPISPQSSEQSGLGAGAATTPQGAIESPTAPITGNQTQTQQTNEIQSTLQNQGQVVQEADAEASAQTQEGVLTPAPSPVVPTQAAVIPQEPVADETSQGGVADIQTTPQTANGKRVGDAINPGENILVASEKDESSPDMPTEYTVIEVETIVNPKKNEVHAKRRNMTPDEIARTQQKMRDRNELAAEMGMPQEVIPEVPVGPTEPSSQPAPETQQPSDVPETDFANTQPEGQAQAGTPQREGQGQEVADLAAVRDNAATPEQVQRLEGQGLVERVNGQNVITQAGIQAMPEAERPRLTEQERRAEIQQQTQPVEAVVELTELPSYFQRNPQQKKLWNVDESYSEPTRISQSVGDKIGPRGTAFTVEQLMYQIAVLREFVSNMNGRLLRGGDKGASAKQLAESWTNLRGFEALAAKYAAENPQEWQGYRNRQNELLGLEPGADVIVPYPSPDTAPLGNIAKLDRKFSKNWRVIYPNGDTALLHPTALRAVSDTAEMGDTGVTIPGAASTELEREAIISSPQYTQEWLQDETAKAQEAGVQDGDTVVTRNESGETIVGTVAATTGETTTISTTSGDVTVPTAGLVRQSPQSLSRKLGLAQALMESDGAALQLGVSARDVEKGIAATKRQIPGAQNIWSGTRQDFLDTFGNDPSVQDIVAQLEEGVMTEGFYVPSLQRGFILTDGVVVYQGDADRAALNGTTPAVEAVKRLIRHEVGGHGGWLNLTERQTQDFLNIARDVIPVSEMNQMIEDGYPFQDWQTNDETFRQAAEEWFSQRLGRMDKLPETGPLARFVEWLKGVWRWLTGRKTEPDLQAIKNLWRQIRMNEAAIAMGRAWYSLPREGARAQAVTALDAEYFAAASRGDSGSDNLIQLLRDAPESERKAVVDAWVQRNPKAAAEMQRMVDAAAKAAGFNTGPLQHWTNAGPFTEFDPSKTGSAQGMESQIHGIWFNDSTGTRSPFGKQLVRGFARMVNPKRYRNAEAYFNDQEQHDYNGAALTKTIKEAGFDGVIIKPAKEWAGSQEWEFTNYVIFDPSQIKSADPVTYDSSGAPIPPSQRFQSTSNDIRYSRQQESIKIQRFNELTRDLPAKPTAADIAKFQETHPDEYAELVKMRADVLKRGGWTFGPVYHGTKELFNIFNPTRYEDKLSYFALDKGFSKKWVENRLPPKGSEAANRIERVRNDSREFVNDLFEKTLGAANDLDLAAELFEQQKQFERDNLDGMTVYEAERKMGGRIIAAYLKANNVFDPSKSWREFLPQILRYLNVSSESEIDPQVMRAIKDGGYLIWENKSIVDAVLSKYDAIMIQEEQGGGRDTIAIRGSENIKSADPLATDDSGNLITPDQWVNKKSGDIRYSRVRSNAEIASAIRQQATLPNDPQTASEGKVIREDVAAQFEPNDRRSIQQSPDHQFLGKDIGVERGAAILDTLMQPERDPAKIAESTPQEIEQQGGDVELNLIAHEEAVRRALVLGEAVSTAALTRYGISLPPDYRKFGELSAPVSPALIRATEFLTNQSLTEQAGIGMSTTLYPYIAYRLMSDIATAQTNARSNVERVALSQAMTRIYQATSGTNSASGQRLGATGIAQRYFGVTAGGVMALVENVNREVQGRIDASIPVDDLVAELNRNQTQMETEAVNDAAAEIEAETEIDLAEADMLKQEGIAEGIIEEIANRLGDAPVVNDVERKEREATIRDLHLRNVRQGMTEQDFIAEAATFEVYEGLASRLWNAGNLEREARATIKAAIDDVRRQEIAESRASRLIYSTEERLRQGSKDLYANASGDSINKAFRDQIKTPVSLADFKERLSKLSVGGDVAERLFRTAEREKADLAEMDLIISKRREERQKAAQVEIAESRASQLIYSVEERLRQGSKDLDQGVGKDTINKAFRDQVKGPVSQEDFNTRLAALNVSGNVAERLFKTAERERADLAKAKEFTDRRRAETEEARQNERAEARASQLIYSTEEKLRQGSKDLDESESRDSINKAFRDQIKSPVSLAEFKARLAKLRVGDVVADRLFKTASRERDDMAESERFLAQRRLERKDQRKIEIAQERASQLIYGVEERLRQGSKDMTENAAKDTINKAFRDQVAKPVSFENFQARLRNLRVNDRNIERMFNTAERERIDLGKQALMQTRENLLEKDSPHLAAVIRRIKDRIAPGISWRDLMVVDAQDGKQRARAIYQRVRQHEALRGLSPAEAAQLTRALNRHFIKAKEKVLKKELERVGATGTQTDPRIADLYEKIRRRELTAAEVEAELQAIATPSRWKALRRELPTFLQDLAYGRVSIEQFKEKIGRGRKATDRAIQSVIDSTPKLVQAMNLGAFNAQAFRDAVSEKFGLRVITSEQARQIQQMVVDAQALQPGLPRDKAVQKIIDQIADYTQMSSAEIFNSFWVSSVLSGGRTQFDTWMNQLNAMRRVLQLAAWTSAKRINAGGLNIGWNAITRYFEVLPGMFQNALWYLWSGDSTLLLSEARETDRFLNDGQFSQSMDTKKAEKLLSGALTALKGGDLKQGILAFPAFFIVGVRRLMQAADYFSAAATLEASIPLAIALNPELAGKTRIPSRQDYQNFRLRAREILTGGREPSGMREKVEERVMAQQLLMQSIDSLAIRDEIMELGIEASYQNDPTGIGGIFYSSVLAVHQKIVASAEALRERGQSMQESDSPEILKKADAAARNLMYALAVGARALTGLQFARFAGNKTNELLGMTPLLGLARLAEKDKTRSQKAMIIMDNLVGTAIAVGGIIYAMGLLDDDDDDERRGWRIEGGWDGLTADETRQLRAAGKQPYSIGYLDRQDGTWKNYSYLQWATSGAFATIGNLRDRKRYRPELWNEDSYVGATLAAAAGNGQALLNMSMLQNLNDIFGGNSAFAARDPVSGMAGWLNRFASNYAGGFIPRAFKDADYMMDPRHTKANAGIELWLQHVPFYRRGVGEPYLDSLGYQVELRREPWSRAFVETRGTAAHNALASLVGKGIFISSLNMDNRVVRNGEDVRPMTDAEQKRMMDVYFPLLRSYLVREGPRIERMPMVDAKEKLSNDIQRLKSEAQDRAVR